MLAKEMGIHEDLEKRFADAKVDDLAEKFDNLDLDKKDDDSDTKEELTAAEPLLDLEKGTDELHGSLL